MWAREGGELAAWLEEAWIGDDPSARWRSSKGHGPGTGAAASGSSVLEVDEGCRVPRHIDTAEETIVVISGAAEVIVEGERASLDAGGLAVIPEGATHEVRNAAPGTLRFAAVYAGTEVLSRYEQEVEPDGERERSPVA